MKKYFVNYAVNKQAEFTSRKEAQKFVKSLPETVGVKVEIGTLEANEWTQEEIVGGAEFLYR